MKSKESKKKESQPAKGRLRENIEAVVIAILLALFIRAFVVQAFKIPSGSMKPTLLVGDHILVNKFIYGIKLPLINKTIINLKKPEKGDIVVFKFPMDPKKDFIKRVIGVAGDQIEIRDKIVYANGERQNHNYAIHTDRHMFPADAQPRDNLGPITVPKDSLFVMGDNRDNSYDSRFWGCVDLKVVKGKAFIIYWSWDKIKFGVRWSRLGHVLK